MFVAKDFLQSAAPESGNHDAGGHEAGADGIIRGGPLAARDRQEDKS